MTDAPPDWWREALADFGERLGFRDTAGWTTDALNLSVADGRYLVDVEPSGDEIVLAVLCPVPPAEVGPRTRLLLRAVAFDRDHPFFLQAGLKGADVLVMAARVERAQHNRLHDALELILALYADMGL